MQTRQVLVGEANFVEKVLLDFISVRGGCDELGCLHDWLLKAGFGIFDKGVVGFSLTAVGLLKASVFAS